MNGNYGYDDGLLSPIQAVGPGPKQIVAGYRNDMMNGSGSNKPRYNPVRCASRSESIVRSLTRHH